MFKRCSFEFLYVSIFGYIDHGTKKGAWEGNSKGAGREKSTCDMQVERGDTGSGRVQAGVRDRRVGAWTKHHKETCYSEHQLRNKNSKQNTFFIPSFPTYTEKVIVISTTVVEQAGNVEFNFDFPLST